MRALIQRVKRCSVMVEGKPVAETGSGMLILLGVHASDTDDDARKLAERCAALRIFDDPSGKMNLSVGDVGGEVTVVSQFTLYADTSRGNRPSYAEAAPAAAAERLYELFVQYLRTHVAPDKVATGVFRAMMEVSLVNDGPVTVMMESRKEQG